MLLSKTGDSPLQMAVRGGHKDVVQLLLKHGADVNAKCKVGKGAFLTSFELALLRTRPNGYYSETIHYLLTDPNINVGDIKPDFVKQNAKRSEDERKFSTKLDQLKEVEKLLKPENKYGFKLSLNYSPNVSGKGATVEVAIKAGGKLLQLLYDYAEKNIGTDTEIFKQLKQAKENSQPKSDVSNVSVSGNLIQAQGFKLGGA